MLKNTQEELKCKSLSEDLLQKRVELFKQDLARAHSTIAMITRQDELMRSAASNPYLSDVKKIINRLEPSDELKNTLEQLVTESKTGLPLKTATVQEKAVSPLLLALQDLQQDTKTDEVGVSLIETGDLDTLGGALRRSIDESARYLSTIIDESKGLNQEEDKISTSKSTSTAAPSTDTPITSYLPLVSMFCLQYAYFYSQKRLIPKRSQVPPLRLSALAATQAADREVDAKQGEAHRNEESETNPDSKDAPSSVSKQQNSISMASPNSVPSATPKTSFSRRQTAPAPTATPAASVKSRQAVVSNFPSAFIFHKSAYIKFHRFLPSGCPHFLLQNLIQLETFN